jgi:hypothetical protein
VLRSVRELKAFYRIANIPPGGGREITIPLRASDLKVYDPTTQRLQVITGPVKVWVGSSSARSTLLPATDSDASTTFNVVP